MSCVCDKCMNFPCGEEANMIIACCDFEEKPKVITNADRIRSMTDEELAEWATTVGRTFGEEYEGYMSALDWLKSPVEVDNGT